MTKLESVRKNPKVNNNLFTKVNEEGNQNQKVDLTVNPLFWPDLGLIYFFFNAAY